MINHFKEEQDMRDAQIRAKIDVVSKQMDSSLIKARRETDQLIEPLQHDLSVVRDKEFQVGKEFEYMLK